MWGIPLLAGKWMWDPGGKAYGVGVGRQPGCPLSSAGFAAPVAVILCIKVGVKAAGNIHPGVPGSF